MPDYQAMYAVLFRKVTAVNTRLYGKSSIKIMRILYIKLRDELAKQL